MSIDAMYWVWLHSQSKGAGRHVMLAVANRITGADGTARVSTAELVRFSNAARSSVIKAIDALVKSGELGLIEEGRGTRAALYKIPGVVGYARPDFGSRGPETGPLADCQGSGNRTSTESPRGPETGPQGSENRTSRGPETGPHNQNQRNHVEEEASSAPSAREITADEKVEFGRFWALYPKSRDYDKTLAEWTAAVLSGADPQKITAAAVAYAREKAGEEFRFIAHSHNWLKRRSYLDTYAPEPNGKPDLRSVGGRHEPWRNPVDQDEYDESFWPAANNR